MAILSRRKRTAKRLAERDQRKIRKAMTNELLDTVLAEYSCQDNASSTDRVVKEITESLKNPQATPISTIEITKAPTCEMKIDDSDLIRLHQQLFPPDTASRMQLILDQLAGKAFPTSQANKHLVLQINQILAGTGLKCVSRDTGQKIRLRFINPPRSRHGYFQLRTSNAQQLAVFTNSQFPSLQVSIADLG